MNKSKIFLLAAVTALAGGALVGVASLSKTNSAQFAKASVGDPVAHTIVFTNGHVTMFEEDDGYAMSELSYKTAAGNTFKSTNIEMEDKTAEGPTVGGKDSGYIYKINNKGWKEYVDRSAYFSASFELEVDVANSVSIYADITYHYDNGTSSSNHTDRIDFNLVDAEGLLYTASFSYQFENKYHQYFTVDTITVNYSCTY